MITKSGGNLFAGAFRSNFTNPAWSVETPLEKSARHDACEQAVADLRGDRGGPLSRDRVWFFGGGRVERTRRR